MKISAISHKSIWCCVFRARATIISAAELRGSNPNEARNSALGERLSVKLTDSKLFCTKVTIQSQRLRWSRSSDDIFSSLSRTKFFRSPRKEQMLDTSRKSSSKLLLSNISKYSGIFLYSWIWRRNYETISDSVNDVLNLLWPYQVGFLKLYSWLLTNAILKSSNEPYWPKRQNFGVE